MPIYLLYYLLSCPFLEDTLLDTKPRTKPALPPGTNWPRRAMAQSFPGLTDNLGHIHCFESHQVGQLIDDDIPAGLDLVYPLNTASLPVGPVDEVPQQCEPKNMWELVL